MKKRGNANKLLRRYKPLFVILLIEVVMVLVFLQMWEGSKPLDERNLKETAICVEEVDHVHWKGGSRVYVFSDSVKYTFHNANSYGQCSNSRLPEMIKVGDDLYITYFVEEGIFGTTNVVVDAYTENHVLRTIEGYVNAHKGVRVFETVMFIMIETLYFGGSILYLWANGWLTNKKTKKKKKK